MLLKVKFSDLVSGLEYVSTVLSDKSANKSQENFIFIVREDSLYVAGQSAYLTCKTEIPDFEVEDLEGEKKVFLISKSSLQNIMSGYENLSKTVPTEVSFEIVADKIILRVTEEDKEGKDERLTRTSRNTFPVQKVIEKMTARIEEPFPNLEDMNEIESVDLNFYFNGLQPLMDPNRSSTGNNLFFTEDQVSVYSSKYSFYVKNKMDNPMRGNFSLDYSGVDLFKKLCTGNEKVWVSREEDKRLFVRTLNTYAVIRCSGKKYDLSYNFKNFTKENGFVVDGSYFKDVLKRTISGGNDSMVFSIATETRDLFITGDNNEQSVSLMNVKGDVDGLKLKAGSQVILKAISGVRDIVGGDNPIYVYLVKTNTRYKVYFTDKTGLWMSTITTNPMQ